MSKQGGGSYWSGVKSRCLPVLTGAMGAALAVVTVLSIQQAQPAPARHASSAASARQTVTSIGVSGGAGAAGKAGTAAAGVSPRYDVPHVFVARTPSEVQAFHDWVARGVFSVPEGADEQPGVILAPSVGEAAFASTALLDQVR